MVQVTDSYFTLDENRVLFRRKIGSTIVEESIRQRFFYSIAHPDPRSTIIWNDPKAKYAWWDGSCLVAALVKEGPKAMVKWRGQ